MLIVAIGTLGCRILGGILGAIEGSSKLEALLSLFRILGL
jgi:hypothetical protein